MTKNTFIFASFLSFFLAFHSLHAQEQEPAEGWEAFSKVKFVPKFFSEVDAYLYVPAFGPKIKALEGQTVKLIGYVMPFEYEDRNMIILSKYPYSQCFFCGAAGPESIAEIVFAKPAEEFEPDAYIEVIGVLSLNKDDVDHLNFIIKNATYTRKNF